MFYIGADTYECYLGNKVIELTTYEINELFDKAIRNDVIDLNEYKRVDDTKKVKPTISKTRKYNKHKKIMELFKKYYDDTKTVKEVLEKIALELGISFKAVEKSYYSKK